MPDLIERLEAIAPSPREDLDFGRIATRARRRRGRRHAGGATALALALVVATFGIGSMGDARLTPEILGEAPGGGVESNAPSSPTREPSVVDGVPSDIPVPGAMPLAPRQTPERTEAPSARPSTAPGVAESATPDVSATPSPSPSSSGATAPSGCRTYENCSFIATGPGGYLVDDNAGPDWTITIERDGEVIQVYSWPDAPRCADGVIEPGDRVTADTHVTVNETVGGGAFVGYGWIAAGEEYGCRS